MRIEKRTTSDYHVSNKSWGHEVWIENNDEYCGKELHFSLAGGATSMHFHILKRETMYCVVGGFRIHLIDTEDASHSSVILAPGDSVEIPRLVPHSIESTEDCSLLLEFSTRHFEEDSYRLYRMEALR